ncbi:MAG TPA: hypothetical protein VJS45_14935 [Acidimicrobiia bacterium]|nr:hypothetical protein [Acidimicrobiia bacterium]
MPSESNATVMTDGTVDWRAVADELAGALRTTMLRNPTLTARDWDRASAALDRYAGATCGVAVEFPKPSDP